MNPLIKAVFLSLNQTIKLRLLQQVIKTQSVKFVLIIKLTTAIKKSLA